jgi:hypothetical protein
MKVRNSPVTPPSPLAGAGDPVVERAEAMVAWLTTRLEADSDASRIDRLVAMDRLTAALDAAKAEETAAFYDSQVEAQKAAGIPARRLGQGVAEQVGLARKMSPARAARYVSASRLMVTQMPALQCAMRAGQVSSWVATLVVRETAELSEPHRRRLDAELAPRLTSMSPRQASQATRTIAYRLDPESIMRRGRTAREDRRVSIRPAPDTMALLTGFLPVEQGVAAYAALDRHARGLRSAGDSRPLGQIMADTMVERLTGQATADSVPIEIGVTISLDSLLGVDTSPGQLAGHGPLPSAFVRALLHNSTGDDDERTDTAGFVRRLITDPVDGSLVAMDSARRRFPAAVARFITRRDQRCRTPYCDASIRHLDHIAPVRQSGPTNVANGQGLCERDNYVKEAAGWTHRHVPGQRHSIEITTPTGHSYMSCAPSALGP